MQIVPAFPVGERYSSAMDDRYPQQLLSSRRDSAAQLSISVRAIDYLVASGQIKTRAIGRRRLIPRSELVRYSRKDHPGPIVPPKLHKPSKMPLDTESTRADLNQHLP
jgi:hypothetical protein